MDVSDRIDTCERIATGLETDGAAALSAAPTVADHGPEPGRPPPPQLPALAVSQRDILGTAGWLRPTAPDAYAAAGGFDDSPFERDTALTGTPACQGRTPNRPVRHARRAVPGATSHTIISVDPLQQV